MRSDGLVIQGGYKGVEIALIRGASIIDTYDIHKHQASRDLIISLSLICERNNTSVKECDFLAAYQGPGPFTTLRVVLATVNGLAFATGIPLVGVDGLDAFIEEKRAACSTRFIIIMLNAFCDDVYFAIYDTKTHAVIKGCEHINVFLDRCMALTNLHVDGTASFYGNAVQLHHAYLIAALGDDKNYFYTDQEIASIQAVANNAIVKAAQNSYAAQLLPLYLKDSSVYLIPVSVDYR